MSPLLRPNEDDGLKPRHRRPGRLRRERRALLEMRAERLQDVGGLLVEMYRRGKYHREVLAESCAAVLGIDERLAEIDDLLAHGRAVPHCECGAPVFRGTHFCPNCGRRRDLGERPGLEQTQVLSQGELPRP
jgi:hypothetical protein